VSFLDIPVLDTNSPAKLYDALAVSTPIIVTNKGWTKTLVEQHGCGWYTPAGDVSSLVATLRAVLAAPSAREAAGQRGRALALAEFDRVEIAARMRKILEQAAGKG
jgi:glycosyltransferase involved in cell wall biosynthesis